ncbi:MAG: baseplate J/gp47 family protein [Tenuifilaceae bacterium]|nr:baseplate J/gp47 family protein [Tenuifilaceae bacterium]
MASYQEKLDRILKVLSDRTGIINPTQGSLAYQLAQSIAYENFLLETKIEEKTKSSSIMYATGSDLDNIGEGFFGIERLKSKRHFISESMRALKIYVTGGRTFGNINNNDDIILPEGTLISGQVGQLQVKFRTNKTITLPYNYTEAYLSADLVQGPDDTIPTNILTTHNFLGYSDYVNKSLVINNIVPIATGRTEESDEDYRYRIKNALKAFNQASYEGIYQTVREVPGVSDAIIKPNSSGGGTFTVYVQGITPVTGDDVISDVMLALSQNAVSPWVNFSVSKPNYIGIQVSIKLYIKDSSTLTSNVATISYITNIVASYINNFYGNTFYFDDILKMINNSSEEILDSSYVAIKLYRGTDIFREAELIDLTEDPHPAIYIDDIEKIILEPISDQIVISIGD